MSSLYATAQIVWRPGEDVIANSNLVAFLRGHDIPDYDRLLARAESDPDWWWRTVADRIAFFQPYDRILDLDKGPAFARWCQGGTTNIVLNALDRHHGTERWRAPVLVHEPESGDATTWTYAELDRHVCRLAGGLRSLGIGKGEVVAMYLPNVPEAVVGLLAIAKIGAVAMPLFSGFGVEAVRTRLVDSGAAAMLTIDGTRHRGRANPMKDAADAAAVSLPTLRHVVCLDTGLLPIRQVPGRDHDWHALCADQPDEAETEQMDAEAPCMLMYTSGTTGRPKGTVHAHAGFAAKLALDLGLLMDIKPSDRILWMSDMGWLVGPILSFGMPILGASFVLADGAPDYPDPTRLWRLVEEHQVTFLGIAPTVIRGFMHRAGTGNHDLSTLRICASTGEAWTPDAWTWTFENVCKRNLPIINYSGGTEIGGGILTGTVIHPMKPCAFSGPIPGLGVDITDPQGNSLPPNVVGELVLRRASIGLTRSLWHDDERYLDSYWRNIPGVWRQGDWAVKDEDGFWFLLGRSDDTLKIAGKRTGPSEVEMLLTATGKVTEAAAIGVKDAIKGESVGCVVVMAPKQDLDEPTKAELVNAVISGLGYPYKPAFVIAVPDLPKTRNMKVMRRLVKAVCGGESLGDTSSLVNPEALDALRSAVGTLSARMGGAT
jgi:acetyl-CoA synthetase